MENSEFQEQEGSKKLLYKYQFAFLVLQKCFTALINVQKTREALAVKRYFSKWQLNLSGVKYSKDKLGLGLSIVKHRIDSLSKTLTNRRKAQIHLAFCNIKKYNSILYFKSELDRKEEMLKFGYEDQVNQINKELNLLTDKQGEINYDIKNLKAKENIYKSKLKEAQKDIRPKNKSSSEIASLKRKKQQLKLEISYLEDSVEKFMEEVLSIAESKQRKELSSVFYSSQKNIKRKLN